MNHIRQAARMATIACVVIGLAGVPPRSQAQQCDETRTSAGATTTAARSGLPAVAAKHPTLTDEQFERVQELNKALNELRGRGDYAGAIPLADAILAVHRRAQGDDSWETRDAAELVGTLRHVAAMPAEAQAELAEADRAAEEVDRLFDDGGFDRALALARRQLQIRRRHFGNEHVAVGVSLNRVGALLHAKGDLDAAEGMYREAIAVAQEARGEEHPFHATYLRNLALCLSNKGDAEAAKPLYEKAVDIQVKTLGGEHLDTARTMYDFALLLYGRGDLGSAEELCRKSLNARRRALGDFHAKVSECLGLLAAMAELSGNLAEAERLRREALAIDRKMYGDRHRRVASKTSDLASALRDEGHFAEAERLLRQALALHRESPERDYCEIVWTIGRLGTVLSDQGKYKQAAVVAQEALEISHESCDGYSWYALGVLGSAFHRMGDYAAAEPLLREALSLTRMARSPEDPTVAAVLSNYGPLLHEVGDYEKAEEVYREALTLRRKAYGERHWCVAYDAYRLGRFLSDRGRYDDADRLLSVAVEQLPELVGPEHWDVAHALHHWAVTLHRKGDVATAKARYREALTLRRQCYGERHPDTAETMIQLGTLLASEGGEQSTSEAEQLFVKGTRILRDSGAPQLHAACTLYGEFLERNGRRPEAARYYAEAVEAVENYRTKVPGDELDRARYLTSLSRLDVFGRMARLQLQLDPDSASGRNSPPGKAFDYLERGRGRALLNLLERSGRDLDALTLDRADRQNDEEVRSRLADVLRRETGAKEAIASCQARIRATAKDTALADTDRAKRIADLTEQLARARAAERQAVRDLFNLARAELGIGQLRPMNADQVAAALKPGELLLAYDIGDRDSVLLVVHPSSPQDREAAVDAHALRWPDGGDVTLESAKATAGRMFAEVAREPLPPAGEKGSGGAHVPGDLLHALVPAPLQNALKQATRVFILADGPLNGLPFESLVVDRKANERWIDLGPSIVYGPSATVLVNRRERATASLRDGKHEDAPVLVALGDPLFTRSPQWEEKETETSGFDTTLATATRSHLSSSMGELKPLPGTRVEVESLAACFRQHAPARASTIRVLTGEDATVTELFNAADRPRFVHLATHGLVAGGGKAFESALALAAPAQVTPTDNGFLRLADLLGGWSGKLDGTELVTLSACRSGRGPMEAGEGFVALTWGFLFAGAESVVVSLWNVDDVSTAILMDDFYRNMLDKRMPKAEALRSAKQTLRSMTREQAERRLKALGHPIGSAARGGRVGDIRVQRPGDRPFEDPYFWAPFVLIGAAE